MSSTLDAGQRYKSTKCSTWEKRDVVQGNATKEEEILAWVVGMQATKQGMAVGIWQRDSYSRNYTCIQEQ